MASKIYDVVGREVITLVNDESQKPGFYKVSWDGKNEVGQKVPTGIYFYRLEIDGSVFVATRKMMVLR